MTIVTDISWPKYSAPEHVEAIEATALEDRGLPVTTFQVLERAARLWPSKMAVSVMPDASLWREPVDQTFGEVAADAARVANTLAAAGVQPGDPVVVVSPNCADLVPAVLGVQAAGILAPLNGSQSVDHLIRLTDRLGANVAIVAGADLDAGLFSKMIEVAQATAVATLLVLEPSNPLRRATLPSVEGLRIEYLSDATSRAGTTFEDTHGPNDLAAIFHTGGTTGMPKLAAHTHRNQVSDAWMIAADSSLDVSRPILAALPLFHVNALHVTVLAPLLRGQHVVWAGPLGFRDPHFYSEIWRIIESYEIVTLSAVPTVYAVLAACPVDADISSLQFAIVGASALPVAVRNAFEEHTGVPLLEGFGLTEATCATSRSFVDHPMPGSVGKRLPYQKVRVVDEAGDDVPEGEAGHLLVAGPAVFAGYVVDRVGDELVIDSLGKVRDGWLETGDLARLHDGFIYLIGRARDLIIRGGHNIEPSVIEAALLSHPEVVDAAAVGRPDPRAGEVPVAFVTLAPGSQADGEAVRRWVSTTDLEAAAHPKSVTVVSALPVTDVGKPYKLALRATATREAINLALAEARGVLRVDADLVDGTVLVRVLICTSADRSDIQARLDAYAVRSEIYVGDN